MNKLLKTSTKIFKIYTDFQLYRIVNYLIQITKKSISILNQFKHNLRKLSMKFQMTQTSLYSVVAKFSWMKTLKDKFHK
jgi:hypothetical protein